MEKSITVSFLEQGKGRRDPFSKSCCCFLLLFSPVLLLCILAIHIAHVMDFSNTLPTDICGIFFSTDSFSEILAIGEMCTEFM